MLSLEDTTVISGDYSFPKTRENHAPVLQYAFVFFYMYIVSSYQAGMNRCNKTFTITFYLWLALVSLVGGGGSPFYVYLASWDQYQSFIHGKPLGPFSLYKHSSTLQ